VRLDVLELPLVGPRRHVPLQLLDAGGGVSILRHIYLSAVSLKVRSHIWSIGFPNLKNLGLRNVTVSTSDLQHMLSNCPNLERLDLYMVHLDPELRVDRPLPRLVYLRLVGCRVTKIELNANRLTTFIFRGRSASAPTITNLGGTSTLRNADIQCYQLTLQESVIVSSLPNAFPMVQRLSLRSTLTLPMLPSPLENTSRFSHLRYLQLLPCLYPPGHRDGNGYPSPAYPPSKYPLDVRVWDKKIPMGIQMGKIYTHRVERVWIWDP
jgi:hypothetical protein